MENNGLVSRVERAALASQAEKVQIPELEVLVGVLDRGSLFTGLGKAAMNEVLDAQLQQGDDVVAGGRHVEEGDEDALEEVKDAARDRVVEDCVVCLALEEEELLERRVVAEEQRRAHKGSSSEAHKNMSATLWRSVASS